jgi:hypothetical protein
MIITIKSIIGNSGRGSPVFSRPGKTQNNEFKVFQSPLPARDAPELDNSSKLRKDDLEQLFDKIKLEKKRKVTFTPT